MFIMEIIAIQSWQKPMNCIHLFGCAKKNVYLCSIKAIATVMATTFVIKMSNRKLTALEMHRISIDEFKQSRKTPLVVVLDDVRSMYNVGSVFRTADAFRIERICLCGITARPPHPEIHKTALGAEDSVDWTYDADTHETVRRLQADGYRVMAIEQVEGSTMLQDFIPEDGGKYAVVMGNEVKGVKQTVVDMCDGCIEIPQFGTKHSLNVSTTAGIVMWEVLKKMKL